MRRDRLLWYEEIIFTLDDLLTPAPVALFSLSSHTSDWTRPQVEAAVDQLSRSLRRQETPDSTTTSYYAALALAVFAVASGGEIVQRDSLVQVVLTYSAAFEKSDSQSSECLALFFALLSLIVSDAEDETRFLAARFLRKLMEICRFSVNLPTDPLPITILPHFIDFLLQHWSRSAVSGLLEWLYKAVVGMWIQSPEVG
ncbi:unnamed protein product [Dibothriocephalus latus]|uniref:Uncharacterized protein n=1 Tax=Dibothriocephalus latus TaxID=60516 RepID=A0A3P7LJZ6_DIBLA|nr:unnamed protein product [Dibothriocephalus latus]